MDFIANVLALIASVINLLCAVVGFTRAWISRPNKKYRRKNRR